MRRIGLLGGMSWESSIEYERRINEEVRARRGGTASADLVIRSYDFSAIEALQEQDRWDECAAILSGDARMLESAGAEVVALCTNTMHVVAPAIEAAIDVPFIHIADATAQAIRASDVQRVALLGTRYTMEMGFYRDRLTDAGFDVLVPDGPTRDMVHHVIFDELVRGIVTDTSRSAFGEAIDRLVRDGAEGVIAGCTEIELLIGPEDVDVPLFPTTAIHAGAIVDAAFA